MFIYGSMSTFIVDWTWWAPNHGLFRIVQIKSFKQSKLSTENPQKRASKFWVWASLIHHFNHLKYVINRLEIDKITFLNMPTHLKTWQERSIQQLRNHNSLNISWKINILRLKISSKLSLSPKLNLNLYTWGVMMSDPLTNGRRNTIINIVYLV